MTKGSLTTAIFISVVAGTLLAMRQQTTSSHQVASQPEPDKLAIAAVAPQKRKIEAPVESPLTSDDSVIAAFKPVDNQVLRRLTPAIEARFERRGKPMGYLSHRIMEIDTEELQRVLRKSLQATIEGNNQVPVAIPVLPDQTIDVVISQWTEGNFGVHIAWGGVPSLSSEQLSRFRFDSNGDVKAVVKTPHVNYLIESATPPYCIIFELERVSAEM